MCLCGTGLLKWIGPKRPKSENGGAICNPNLERCLCSQGKHVIVNNFIVVCLVVCSLYPALALRSVPKAELPRRGTMTMGPLADGAMGMRVARGVSRVGSPS